MKVTVLNLALAASLAAAQPHHHGHARFHQKRDASPAETVDKSADVVVTTYAAATETAYVMAGKEVSPEEAQAGIDKGLYIVVGESTPTFTPPPPPSSTPTPSPTLPGIKAAFIQKSSKAESTAAPTTTSSAPPPPPTSSSKSGAGYQTEGMGLDAEFPDGELDCTWDSVAKYGGIAIPWMGLKGFTGVQRVAGFKLGSKSPISHIVTGIMGEGCDDGAFCSYACPAGYYKTQFPQDNQGATGQSIGGLWCENGKLRLTRPEFKTLCEKGPGGITASSSLGKGAAICRTDYPGTECMNQPLWVDGGSSGLPVANVIQSKYYVWQGKSTSFQYYINPQGVAVEDACTWNSPTNPDSAGNWAPMNMGVGQTDDGQTYLSIFDNKPTSTAKLNFNVDLIVDGKTACTYKDGTYTMDGKKIQDGCTVSIRPVVIMGPSVQTNNAIQVSVKKGQTADIHFYD